MCVPSYTFSFNNTGILAPTQLMFELFPFWKKNFYLNPSLTNPKSLRFFKKNQGQALWSWAPADIEITVSSKLIIPV